MPRKTKAQRGLESEIYDRGYREGYDYGLRCGEVKGVAKGTAQAAEAANAKRLEAMTRLVNTVGQTLQAQAELVNGLAHALSNFR